ncbi:MAG: hypothetical protein JNJ57_05605 [Saprospiraceae bacterium]|nr:hypothetical protein [Saprospiraceae bacterium]
MNKYTSATPAPQPIAGSRFASKKIKTESILGAPSSGCQGVGICRVMPYGQVNPFKCESVSAWIGLNEEGKIRISFLKSAMTSRAMKRHFGWMLFQVYERYELPNRVIKSLGLEKAAVEPGIYTVWEDKRHLTVDF